MNSDGNQPTKRTVSEGAERHLLKPKKVHDHGYVILVSYEGSDADIANAARHSYTQGTRKSSDDATLIRYLRRMHHTSPFEQVSLTFEIYLPLFVQQQFLRHRTAKLNQESLRYSLPSDQFYVPSDPAPQSNTNKQGSSPIPLDPQAAAAVKTTIETSHKASSLIYKRLVECYDLSRELSRTILPTATYTKMVWKMDLNNLCHFLNLRLDSHSQKEIRDYARAIADITRDAFPIAYQAFEDYVLRSVSLSHLDQKALHVLLDSKLPLAAINSENCPINHIFDSKREKTEFVQKMERILDA